MIFSQMIFSQMTTILPNLDAPLYQVNIDFDDSIKQWNSNKKKTPNGYKYICQKNKKCSRVCYKDTQYCYLHRGSV